MPNDKIVQLPSGERVQFPKSMADADINSEITKYLGSKQTGAMQSKPGGPVFNSKLAQPPAADESTLAKIGRGSVLGAASGLGISETQTPVRDTLKNLFSSWVNPSDPEATARSAPPVAMASGVVQGFGKAVDAANPMLDNFFRWLSNKTGGRQFDYRPVDPEQTAHDLTAFGTQLAALKGGKETTDSGLGVSADSLRNVGREVVGEGASKAKVLGDMHAHALETQKHIAGVAEQVHTDAQQAMARVSQAVDSAKPEGAFDKGEVRDRVKAAMGDTLSDESQLPTSLKKLTAAEKPTFAGFVTKNTQGLISRLREGGLSDSEIGDALKQQGFRPEEVKAAISQSAGAQPGRMSFEEVKQARSDLGRQRGRLQGPAQAAGDAAYAELSKILREGARDAQVEPDWIDANARYKNYMDDFVRSPLSKTLEGENAHDIMDALTGKSRAQVMGILGKYTPFGMDMERIGQEVNRSGMGDTVMKLSRPGKMDLLLARLSPSAVALRQAGPRMFRNPKVLSAIAGKGFEPETIPPEKVFPSKAAAMKAAKAEPATTEDWTEEARRRAPGISPERKSIRRKMGGDTEKKFRAMDRLRKKAEEEE